MVENAKVLRQEETEQWKKVSVVLSSRTPDKGPGHMQQESETQEKGGQLQMTLGAT